MKKLIFTVLILSFLSGCNTIKDLANVQKPSVRYSSMSIEDISFSDVTLIFDFDVTNPNSFGVSADQYQYEFFINGNEFVTGIQNEKFRIANNSTTTIQVPVSLTFSEVFETVSSVARQDSMAYRLSTEVRFDIAGLGKQRVPVSTQGELPIPKMPRIELNSFEVEDLSLMGADLVAAFRIENPNPFGISFANTFYNIEVNGKDWLNTTLERNINLNGSESDLITIPIRLNSSQMGSVLMDMLRGETEFEYHLTGSAEVSADIKGFTGMDTISFDRTGTYRMD
ncbi:LEA type 2 family protein [Rhodohalobacter sp. 614A]|uniref:LEA type 2 family protein n=1 Tax=Rhodohalobacter sp. 614A TaxID=2908649 RepID=UPI001F413579|nr:LEA type 2 family protein [Rhodohalobacter sp. 614A]